MIEGVPDNWPRLQNACGDKQRRYQLNLHAENHQLVNENITCTSLETPHFRGVITI
jgi:hypothetical protein